MNELIISVTNLRKSYNQRVVVDGVSIQIGKGKIYGFLGPNGSGKTTTLRLLCGLLTPDAGEGTCLGYDIRTQSDLIKKYVGYMPQKFGLYEDLSVYENLMFMAAIYDIPAPQKAILDILNKFEFNPYHNHMAGALSGGWKQRLALAGCILHSPHLLLLDEPTAGVDPLARRQFWAELHLLAEGGMTILVSTHYMDEAERCHEIAYLFGSKILIQGPVQDVISRSALQTWVVEGEDMKSLTHALKELDTMIQVTPFGRTLHISGPQTAQLGQILQPFFSFPGTTWTPTSPSLEDVFVHLMRPSPVRWK